MKYFPQMNKTELCLKRQGLICSSLTVIQPVNNLQLNKFNLSDKNAFISPIDVSVDSANQRALILDGSLNAIVAVHMPSGESVIISR